MPVSLTPSTRWGTETSLGGMLLAVTDARDANDLLHRFYTAEFPRSRVASYAKLVDEAAGNGDRIAQGILCEAAERLAEYAGAVRRQLFEPREPARVSYLGGVFRSRVVLERFREAIEAQAGNQLAPPVYGPAAGALLEAYRAAGIACALSNVPEEKP